MTKLLAMSHSPLLHYSAVPPEVEEEVQSALTRAKDFVAAYDPALIITFAPDHYNGFFYDVMPPFAVGTGAYGIGDYGSATGDLEVPADKAESLAAHVLADDLDITVSRRMGLDHGAIQPLEHLFDGDITAKPVIPIFLNGVAPPFGSMRRVRLLGQSVGRWVARSGERVLLCASGGLSHDPPVPQWDTASEPVRAGLLDGRHPTPEARSAREDRVIQAAAAFARGEADIQDLNPEWDAAFMQHCAHHDIEAFDAYEVDEMTRTAGHSSHEVRTWLAAFSALGAIAPYRTTFSYYRPIREYIAGFGIMTAELD